MARKQYKAHFTTKTQQITRAGWDPLAHWYDGWVGKDGSHHHRQLAIPSLLELLHLQAGEDVLDIGAGQGVLAPYIARTQANYVGVEVSPRLLRLARQRHGNTGTFLQGDARYLARIPGIQQASFDAAVFLLSIQDMNPLQPIMDAVAWALRGGGRIVIVMTHPCFRIPRQSGWGWQEDRKLQYRRIDRYLTPLTIPMKPYPGQTQGTTLSFHRPLEHYVNGLARSGLLLDQMREITTYKTTSQGPHSHAENLAHQEIPLFLAIRARKTT
ncbi:class I SAM-dependent methyltransferase [Ktedonospora formicarum]|uniref:rRNA methylase n=1 Tax=Ktedonospora formicarum TaxID=2778364 RepID=A0A8J3MU75_9CHLR|nr:class I SAM-dependent methyltransferase [Ktedonospora formicarum]GHO46646.1 rRNA methylase [Ktedonospora formicarum]